MTHRTETILKEIASLSVEERGELLHHLELEDDLLWSQLSEKAFAEDWYSEEDSIYDNFPSR